MDNNEDPTIQSLFAAHDEVVPLKQNRGCRPSTQLWRKPKTTCSPNWAKNESSAEKKIGSILLGPAHFRFPFPSLLRAFPTRKYKNIRNKIKQDKNPIPLLLSFLYSLLPRYATLKEWGRETLYTPQRKKKSGMNQNPKHS